MSRTAMAAVILQLLDPDSYTGTSEYGWTLDEAAERISHINIKGQELRDTLAYLACQVHSLREASDRDATLAIAQIETIVRKYRERKP